MVTNKGLEIPLGTVSLSSDASLTFKHNEYIGYFLFRIITEAVHSL
jgi:hypothetical protein